MTDTGGHLCDGCETAPATTTRTEGGSTPVYGLCADCAATFDEATAPTEDMCRDCGAAHPDPAECDPLLTFDEATAAGFDGTGRDGDPRFPYHRSDVPR